MAQEFDPYVMLGIGYNANEDEVKRAYRRLAQRLHPDKNQGYKSAQEQFQVINSAQELLLDENRRRQYDANAQKNRTQNPLYYTMRITPSRRTLQSISEPQVLYMLAEIMPMPEASENTGETRLNLTLVIDQSNSMDDEKRMTKVKAAAQSIIEQLSPQDILSVVSFNDRANLIIPAQKASDKNALRARITLIKPSGGTEIFHGLSEGIKQNRLFLNSKNVNHVILLTDGRTYGDEPECLALAQKAKDEGISISTMGLGSDWNDKFLDQLASSTGATSIYVRSINSVNKFLDEQVRSLSNAFAERMKLSIAPDPDIRLEMAFKLAPNPQPLPHEDGIIPLSSLQIKRQISLLLQFQLPPNLPIGYRTLARLVASGNILQNKADQFNAVSDLSIEVTENPATEDRPPLAIVDALSKLTLYRLQEKAQDALETGNINEATKRLEYLATRLYDMGESTLGQQAMLEAQHVRQTSKFSSAESKLTIKYQTRSLMGTAALGEHITSLIQNDNKTKPNGKNEDV